MRRNVCDSATEIPYWWCKICLESSHKCWLDDEVVALFCLLFSNWQAKGYKGQMGPWRNIKLNKFAFGTQWLLELLCKHWFMSSVWSFCGWVTKVPPRKTSPVARSKEKRQIWKAISAVVGLVSFCTETSGGVAKCWLFSHANSCADFSTMAIYLDCPHSDGELILCWLSLRVKN